jgi:hypothetical protein
MEPTMMRHVSLFLIPALAFVAGCPDDDDLGGRVIPDAGPIDAGPAPHHLPIEVGDEFRYRGMLSVTEGCQDGFVNDACEKQATWLHDITVTDKVPNAKPEGGDCPSGTRETELNAPPNADGESIGSVTYCIPARGWDNVYQLAAGNVWDLEQEHPDPNAVSTAWVFNIAPWTEAQKGPYDGEQNYRTNLAILPERTPKPYAWAMDLSKWSTVAADFEREILDLDPEADISRPEGGAYMTALLNYERNGEPIRHTIEVLYHSNGYLCSFKEEIGPPGPRNTVMKSADGAIRSLIKILSDPAVVSGERRRPRCCTPLANGSNSCGD